MEEYISRQAAIDTLYGITAQRNFIPLDSAVFNINKIPTAEPTLYGYKLEHLAYIARVMEKEGVTAEYAVRTFDDMGRAVKMILDEVQERLERSMKEWIQI